MALLDHAGVAARPQAQQYQFMRPSQGLGVGSYRPVPRGSFPPPTTTLTPTVSASDEAEKSPEEKSVSSTMAGNAFFRAPSNWFLPGLRKWPNYRALAAQSSPTRPSGGNSGPSPRGGPVDAMESIDNGTWVWKQEIIKWRRCDFFFHTLNWFLIKLNTVYGIN